VAAALALPDLGARPRVTYQTLPRGHFRNANGVAATGGQESKNGRPTSRYDPPIQR
jgi:hypothetical protein